MGTWSVSMTGNDTAQDLISDYIAAFYKYEPAEAAQRIEKYVRERMFDESDEEEWCNFFYSLADFMWKKGVLTDEVRNRAIEMIDTGFGLGLWAEAGGKTLKKRQKVLSEFKAKLLSPMPPRKKIRPNCHMERILENGDLIAVQLKTAGKPYTATNEKYISEDEFHSFDGKYILMQLIDCIASWTSSIVPEVKDYWACFRLFDGVYNQIPEEVNFQKLKPAKIHEQYISSCFTCECSLYYFKRRGYQLIGNFPAEEAPDHLRTPAIFFGIEKPWYNPDSLLLSAMGKEVICREFRGSEDEIRELCISAYRGGKYDYRMSRAENEKFYEEETARILAEIQTSEKQGRKVLSLQFGNRTVGIVTADRDHIDHLCIRGGFQNNGFGKQLLQYAISLAENGVYIDVPKNCRALIHICQGLPELIAAEDLGTGIRYVVKTGDS